MPQHEAILVGMSVLVLCGIGCVLWRIYQQRVDIKRNLITGRTRSREKPQLVRSPLAGLSFSEAISITPMWEAIRSSSEEMMMKQFTAQLGDGIVAGTNAIRFVQATGEYVIEFSEHGRELLKVGKATLMKSKETGQMIPKLMGLDGRIIETGREVGKLKSVAGKLASLSSMVVGVAHIISGADVAKKLGKVGRDVTFLVEAMHNSKMGKLEAIYHSAQQILAKPLTEHVQSEIRLQMREIAEVRATSRRNLETKLQGIANPHNGGFFQKYFTTERSKDEQIAREISECQQDMAMLEMTMVLQIALAQSVGDGELFFQHSLPSELSLLRGTAKMFAGKATFITGKYSDVHVEPMIAGINGLIERISALAPAAQSLATSD
jgi:hypothetical protein